MQLSVLMKLHENGMASIFVDPDIGVPPAIQHIVWQNLSLRAAARGGAEARLELAAKCEAQNERKISTH